MSQSNEKTGAGRDDVVVGTQRREDIKIRAELKEPADMDQKTAQSSPFGALKLLGRTSPGGTLIDKNDYTVVLKYIVQFGNN